MPLISQIVSCSHTDVRLIQAVYLVFRNYEPKLIPSVGLLLALPCLLTRMLGLTFSSTVIAVLTYWTLIIVFTVAYRISPFHPLANYPGPTLAKVSKYYAAYINAVHADSHIRIKQWHGQYGDVIRIGNACCSCYESVVLTLPC